MVSTTPTIVREPGKVTVTYPAAKPGEPSVWKYAGQTLTYYDVPKTPYEVRTERPSGTPEAPVIYEPKTGTTIVGGQVMTSGAAPTVQTPAQTPAISGPITQTKPPMTPMKTAYPMGTLTGMGTTPIYIPGYTKEQLLQEAAQRPPLSPEAAGKIQIGTAVKPSVVPPPMIIGEATTSTEYQAYMQKQRELGESQRLTVVSKQFAESIVGKPEDWEKTAPLTAAGKTAVTWAITLPASVIETPITLTETGQFFAEKGLAGGLDIMTKQIVEHPYTTGVETALNIGLMAYGGYKGFGAVKKAWAGRGTTLTPEAPTYSIAYQPIKYTGMEDIAYLQLPKGTTVGRGFLYAQETKSGIGRGYILQATTKRVGGELSVYRTEVLAKEIMKPTKPVIGMAPEMQIQNVRGLFVSRTTPGQIKLAGEITRTKIFPETKSLGKTIFPETTTKVFGKARTSTLLDVGISRAEIRTPGPRFILTRGGITERPAFDITNLQMAKLLYQQTTIAKTPSGEIPIMFKKSYIRGGGMETPKFTEQYFGTAPRPFSEGMTGYLKSITAPPKGPTPFKGAGPSLGPEKMTGDLFGLEPVKPAAVPKVSLKPTAMRTAVTEAAIRETTQSLFMAPAERPMGGIGVTAAGYEKTIPDMTGFIKGLGTPFPKKRVSGYAGVTYYEAPTYYAYPPGERPAITPAEDLGLGLGAMATPKTSLMTETALRTGLMETPRLDLGQVQTPVTGITTGQLLITSPIQTTTQRQILQLGYEYPRPPELMPPYIPFEFPPTPGTPFPPLFPPPYAYEKKRRRYDLFGMGRMRVGYPPSLSGILSGFTIAKRPRLSTGFETRYPIRRRRKWSE